jgi:hypothetical protein
MECVFSVDDVPWADLKGLPGARGFEFKALKERRLHQGVQLRACSPRTWRPFRVPHRAVEPPALYLERHG